MKLQLALDVCTIEGGLKLVESVVDYIDIIEIGTPLIIEHGLHPVVLFKEAFPQKMILADAKIMDAGEHEANLCFAKGADIVTVLGVAHNSTIAGVVRAAKTYGKQVMVDMIDVIDLQFRAQEVERLGVDYVCVHTAFDIQSTGVNPLDELRLINEVLSQGKAAVAGGVKVATVKDIVKENPEIIVVGGGITSQFDPAVAARRIKEIMEERV
ncbi:MAG: 3-hexulose-6-phosphate synthase [Firmicutes bacterium HGW-Firmicutes-20]|jgi:3-hexulose-6-phosphate synthase|nr:MAG: 3-hexulose-6-phosphate synthase [Firmicutes bacterium HGW-Firmicutes-20]PKM69296.1 MAG: 3-hexulose-6-phosphate synthase [Firmicutes bacterium HGW-Firmicutes-19]